MITRYKNIMINKVSDHNGEAKAPTHKLVVADAEYENKQFVGAFWTKEGKYGKFLSGQLDKTRNYDGKTFSGWSLVKDEELDKLLADVVVANDKKGGMAETLVDLEGIPF